MTVAEALEVLGPALTDPWFLVDEHDAIVDFNAAFRTLFPRQLARGLKGKGCRDALTLPPCGTDRCLRTLCEQDGALRLDEVDAELAGAAHRVILTALPVPLPEGKRGTLILLRDVTDEARVQDRYKSLVERSESERATLEAELERRTRELLATNEALNAAERTLADLRREGVRGLESRK